jgi:hypothetical protein
MKILLLDCETSPLSVYAWSLFKPHISLNQIQDTSRTLCVAYKWLGEKKTHFLSEWKNLDMIEQLWGLLDEADVVITYNGNRFDLPVLNKEFLLNGHSPPSPYKSVDLYRTVKSKFRFASNKLDHVAQQLGLGKKASHYGFELWVDVMSGDEKARKIMEKYNVQDVVLLERLYESVLPWISNHPNHSSYSLSHCCPSCGGKHLQHRGYAVVATGLKERYQCQDCGKWSQSAQVTKKHDISNRVVGAA